MLSLFDTLHSMKVYAYICCDPLLESFPDPDIWKLEKEIILSSDEDRSDVSVDRVYQDFGKRIALQELIEDCQISAPNYLLIRCLEDLGNSLIEITSNLYILESFGIEIITLDRSYSSSKFKLDLSNNMQNNLARLLQEIQKNQHRQRLKQGHARNRIKTLPPPGKAPYGYRRGKDKYIVDRSTAPMVKDFFERFLLFGSLRGAVRYLEKRYGKKIAVSTGRSWLTNPVYRGDLVYKNGETIADTHVPILSREEAAQIDRLLRRNSRLASRSASAPRSLAGLVVCQQCQSSMTITSVTTKNKKSEYLYLRPINCQFAQKCRAISYQKVFDRTIETICRDLPAAVAQLNLPNMDNIKGSLTAKIAKKKEIFLQISTLQEQGILDEETSSLRSYKLRTEIAELEASLAQLPPENLQSIASSVSISQFWLDLSESERRFYFREFIRQIEIIRNQDKSWEIRIVFIF